MKTRNLVTHLEILVLTVADPCLLCRKILLANGPMRSGIGKCDHTDTGFSVRNRSNKVK